MNNSEKIEFLGGQVHALIGFATAVITASDDLAYLARHLDFVSQTNLVKAENALVDEMYVEGVLDVQKRLKSAVETALAHRAKPSSGK